MRSFDNIVAKYFPTSTDKWHLCLLLTLTPAITPSFITFTQLAFLLPGHHCRQPTVNSTSWSPMDVVNLSIPYKANPQLPPRIGQPFHPCIEYDIDALWSEIKENMTMTEALSLRESMYPNLTVRKCSRGVVFLPNTGAMRLSAGEYFETVCDREYFIALSNSVYMVGMFVGFISAGPLADNFGRRPVILGCCIACHIFGVLTGFSANVYMFMALRLLVALFMCMSYISGCILLSECFTKDGRNLYTTLLCSYENLVARPVLVLILYVVQDWSWSHIVYCFTAVFVLAGFYAWTESPRWLVSKGRVDDGLTAVLTIQKRNGRVLTADETQQLRQELDTLAGPSEKRQENDVDEVEMDGLIDEGRTEVEISPQDARSESMSTRCGGEWLRLSNLLRLPELRRLFLLILFIFISHSFVYIGTTFYSVRLNGNPYLIAVVTGLIGMPACVMKFFIYRLFDRKWPMVVFYGCTTVLLGVAFVFVLCGNRGVPVIVSCTVGMLFVYATYNMLYTRTPELFSSTYRGTALGAAAGVSRLGSIMAMNVERLDDSVWPALPLLLFTTASLLNTIVAAFLPPGRGEME